MRAQIVKLVTEKGGIYFASSVAEDLFFEAFTHFLKRCRDEMGIEDFGAAVELVDAKDTPTITLSKCRDARLFTTILPRFSAWLRTDGFDEYLRLLHISNAVLSFECNRPFYQVGQAVNDRERDAYLGNWYVDPPMLRMTGEMYKVPEIARPDVLKLLRRWLGNIPKECKEGVPDIPD